MLISSHGSLIWLLTLSNFQHSPLLFESFFCLRLFSFVDCMLAEFLGLLAGRQRDKDDKVLGVKD
jgi:hypothetical protein